MHWVLNAAWVSPGLDSPRRNKPALRRPGTRVQPCWVSCQIRLKVWLNPLPAFASIFSSGKILLHPRRQAWWCSAPPQAVENYPIARVLVTPERFFAGVFFGGEAEGIEGMKSGSDSAASFHLEAEEFFRQAPVNGLWHPCLRRAPFLAPNSLLTGMERWAYAASSYPATKTATMSFIVNVAFRGTVNPSAYKHVLSSLVLRLAKYASEFSPTPDTKDSVTDGGGDHGNGRGKTTTYLHHGSQTLGGWDGSRTSSRSGAMAWKPREPPSPTVGWCTRRRALPGPRARGSFKLNYALSDGCLYSPCSILFYYKYLQSVFNLRLPAYIFLSDSNLQRFHQTSVCWRFGANGLILPSPALSCRKRTRHKNLEIHFLHPLIRLYFPSFYIVWTVYFRIHFLNTFWK